MDPFGNSIACPEGCVPLDRMTLWQMASLGRFERFFLKHPLRLSDRAEGVCHCVVAEVTDAEPFLQLHAPPECLAYGARAGHISSLAGLALRLGGLPQARSSIVAG